MICAAALTAGSSNSDSELNPYEVIMFLARDFG